MISIDFNDLNNRFLMNIQCWDLPDNKKIEIKDYISNQLKTTYKLKDNKETDRYLIKKNLVIPKSAVFIRYLYITIIINQ